MTLPPDLAAIVRDMADAAREADAIGEGLTDAQFNWQPDDGRAWSIAQCLDHLNVAARVYLDALDDAVRAGRAKGRMRVTPVTPGMLERWFIRQMEPTATRRLKAPAKIVPASRKAAPEVLSEFARERTRAIRFVRDNADLDLGRIRYANPLAAGLRLFSVGAGLLIVCAHDRRHLLQARRVRERGEFPGS